MGTQTTRKLGERAGVWRTVTRLSVAVVALLLVTASLVVGPSAAASSSGPAVDIVFVFDNSQSTNEDRYHMAQEMDGLAADLDASDVDARYGLVTYNETVRTEQPLTDDFDAFERAMHFRAGGNEERASAAVLTATEMAFRDDAETVVVLVTDEDDDASNATRDAAQSALSDVHFVSVSPATPLESSCAVHSPPCDDRSDNELRTIADRVGGDWIDESADAETVVDRIADAALSTVSTERSAAETDGENVDAAETDTEERVVISRDSADGHPTFETVGLSTNRTTAEVGDPVRVNKTVENTGAAPGTYQAYLSHRGTILAEKTVRIPASSSRTITFVHAFEAAGTYETLVTHEVAGTVEVVPPRNATVDATIRADGSGLNATVSDARANGTVSVPVDGAGLADPGVAAFERVTVSVGDVDATPAHDVAFAFELGATETPPEGTEPLPEHVSRPTYLTVTDSPNDSVAGVAFDYTASNDTTLYRYSENASAWVPVDHASAAGADRRTTTEHGGSTFAVGVSQPAVTVTGVELADRTVEPGETAVVTATVTNDGAAGTHEAALTVDGSVVATERLDVPAGETRRVAFEYAFEQAGTHAVGVAGTTRTLRVAATETATTTPETTSPTAESTERTTIGTGAAPNAVLSLLVAVLLLGVLVRRRR